MNWIELDQCLEKLFSKYSISEHRIFYCLLILMGAYWFGLVLACYFLMLFLSMLECLTSIALLKYGAEDCVGMLRIRPKENKLNYYIFKLI